VARKSDVLAYLPHVLRQAYELQGVALGQERVLDALWQGAEDALNDQFIDSVTENGVCRWEQMLGLWERNASDLPERIFRVRSALSGRLPFTLRVLKGQLDHICGEGGYRLSIDYGNYKVTVLLALESGDNFDAVKELLCRMLPANLVIEVSLLYREHGELTGKKHKELAAYTHRGIREGGEI